MSSQPTAKPSPSIRVYGATFRLRSTDRSSDELLADAANGTWRWATGSEGGTWVDGRNKYSRGDVVAETATDDGIEVRHLTLSHPDEQDPAASWRTTVDLVRSGRVIDVFGLLTRRDPAGGERLPGRFVTIPKIIRELADLGASSGRHPISSQPHAVGGSESVEEFVEGVLLDPARNLPVILFSPTSEGDFVPSREAIDSLARGTLGVAHVYYLREPRDTFELSDRLGKQFSAWNGAVRLYWPGFKQSNSPFDHPLFVRNRIGPWVIEWLRRDMISRRLETLTPLPVVAGLLDKHRRERERNELIARLSAAQDDLAMLDLYRDEVERLSYERDDLIKTNSAKDAELQHQQSELKRQADEIRDLKYRLRSNLHAPTETDDEITWLEPETLEEAVLQAADAFTDTLVFTEKAFSSASRMNTADNPPSRLWRIFRTMDDVCRRWRTDTLGMPISTAFQQAGFPLAQVSDVTKGRYRDAYHFSYKGERVSVGPHVDISKGERVYWYNDEEDRQFIVNHIGQHLPDSTT
jgi:hypothetical protein